MYEMGFNLKEWYSLYNGNPILFCISLDLLMEITQICLSNSKSKNSNVSEDECSKEEFKIHINIVLATFTMWNKSYGR